jgi:hypothetical protein
MMTIPRPSGILVIGTNPKLYPTACLASIQEAELDAMTTECTVTVDHAYKEKRMPGRMHREVHDHNNRYNCDGHIFVSGQRKAGLQ